MQLGKSHVLNDLWLFFGEEIAFLVCYFGDNYSLKREACVTSACYFGFACCFAFLEIQRSWKLQVMK